MLEELQQLVERLTEKFRKGDEIPAETLRRVFLSGELTETDFLKYRNVGKKSFRLLTFVCGLKKSESRIVPADSH